MTVQEAIDYINNFTWSASRPGLERTFRLLELLGNPQKELKFIHVAGTNGKGSTCAMTAQILKEAGYRVGLYPSPYIEDFRERIQINGECIPEEDLARITGTVAAAADSLEDHPSQFELITAIGMLYFKEMKCDAVVLEVGMGGALDSTNVIDAPVVSVITNIGLDHTEYLGNTIEEIAAAKAGIIKQGSETVCYDNEPSVLKVIRGVCLEKQVPLHVADAERIVPVARSLEAQTFSYKGTEYRLALLGEHQMHNGAVVLETIDVLRRKGFRLSEEAVRLGLMHVQWPARFEVLSENPLFILDGGHNPQCAQALAVNLKMFLPEQKVTFLIGILADKDYKEVLSILAPFAARFICVTPLSPRALPAEELSQEIRGMGYEATALPAMEKAIRSSRSFEEPVIAFGSLYMAGELRGTFRRLYGLKAERKQADR